MKKIILASVIPILMFGYSIALDNNQSIEVNSSITDFTCVFPSVLNNTNANAKIDMKSKESTAYIENVVNNSECELYSNNVYHSNKYGIKCADTFATAAHKLSAVLDVHFNFNATLPHVSKKPAGSSDSISISKKETVITKNKINNIKQNDSKYSFKIKINSKDLQINKLDEILNDVYLQNTTNKDIEIGSIFPGKNGNTNIVLDGVPQSIKIYKISVSGSNKFSVQTGDTQGFEANNKIEIDEIDLKNSESTDIVFKAPTINIRQIDMTSQNKNIVIYANTINIDEIDLGKNNTITIHPYTPGGKVKFYNRQIDFSSSSTILVDNGNYYIRDIDIPNGNKRPLIKAISPQTVVNLFIDSKHENYDFEIGNGFGINSNPGGDFGENPPENFRIFVNGNLKTHNGDVTTGVTINGMVYVTGNVKLGTHTYVKGAITAQGNIVLSEDVKLYPNSSSFGKCSIQNTTQITKGIFDAWDEDKNSNDRHITTKIANKKFTLNIAFLQENKEESESGINVKYAFSYEGNYSNNGNTATQTVNSNFNINSSYQTQEIAKSGINVKYALYDLKHHKAITDWYDFNIILANKIQKDFKIPNAYQDVRVAFKMCAIKDSNEYILYPYEACKVNGSDNTNKQFKLCMEHNASINDNYNHNFQLCMSFGNENQNKYPQFYTTYSSDNFAIRPYGFRMFGINQYKRAGETFSTTIKAVDEDNYNLTHGKEYDVESVNGYDAKLSTLNIQSKFYTPTKSMVRKMNKDVYGTNSSDASKVAYCPNPGKLTIVKDDSFDNGSIDAQLSFDETGVIELNVSEKKGSEWAYVDENDTPDSQRYIKPATVVYDADDISKTDVNLFIPYKFETTGEYKTTNQKEWLYMSNIDNSNQTFTTPKMSAYVTYNIVAKNKDGKVVKNYTATCFPDTSDKAPKINGLKLNSTFDLFLDTKLHSYHDENISLYVEDNNSNAIYTPVKNTSLEANKDTVVKELIFPLNFKNGQGQAKVYFNISKDNTKELNPDKIAVVDINTSTSWMNNPGATNKFVGQEINQDKTFYYGRVHGINYATINPTIDNMLYVEVYCDLGKKCSDFGIKDWKESKDDIHWWINPLHSDAASGVIKNITTSQPDIAEVNPYSNVEFDKGTTQVTLTYKKPGVPNTIRVFVYPDSWLFYNPYDAHAPVYYDVVFKYSTKKWTGIGQTGKVVDMNASMINAQRVEW